MIISVVSCFLAQLLSSQTSVLVLSLLLFVISLIKTNRTKTRGFGFIDFSVSIYIVLIILGLIIGVASGYPLGKVFNNGAPFLALASFYFFANLTSIQLLTTLRFYLNLLLLLSIFFVIYILLFRTSFSFLDVFSFLFGDPSTYTGFDSTSYIQIYSPKLFMLFPVPVFMALRPEYFFFHSILEKQKTPIYIIQGLSLLGSLIIFVILILSTLSDASVIVCAFFGIFFAFRLLSIFHGRLSINFLTFLIIFCITLVAFLMLSSSLNFALPSFDLGEGGNVKRLRLIHEIINDTSLLPLGFGASIHSIFNFDSFTNYNTELSYLNVYHKFGLFSLLFSPLMLVWFRCIFSFLVSVRHSRDISIVFYVSSSLYMFYAIGNPILSLCSFLFVQGFSLAFLRSSSQLFQPPLPLRQS